MKLTREILTLATCLLALSLSGCKESTPPSSNNENSDSTTEAALIYSLQMTGPLEFSDTIHPVVSWSQVNQAGYYTVSLSDANDATCSSPLQQIQTTALSYRISRVLTISQETFHACVTAHDNEGRILANAARQFTIDVAAPSPFSILPLDFGSNASRPTIRWSAASGADYYELTIAQDSRCIQPFISATLPGTEYTIEQKLLEGRYWICVSAWDAIGHRTSTYPLSFEINAEDSSTLEIIFPRTTPFEATVNEPSTISWESTPRASYYIVGILSEDDCTANLIEADLVTESQSTTSGELPDGEYYACLLAFKEEGLLVEWSASTEYAAYEITIATDPDCTQPVESATLTQTYYVINTPLETPYHVCLSALDESDTPVTTSRISLPVFKTENISPPSTPPQSVACQNHRCSVACDFDQCAFRDIRYDNGPAPLEGFPNFSTIPSLSLNDPTPWEIILHGLIDQGFPSLGLELWNDIGNFQIEGQFIVPSGGPTMASVPAPITQSYMRARATLTPATDSEEISYAALVNGERRNGQELSSWTACRITQREEGYFAQIVFRYGDEDHVRMEHQVETGEGTVECVNFHQTLAMYFNGQYLGALRDDLDHPEGLFVGLQAQKAKFNSTLISDLSQLEPSGLTLLVDRFRSFDGGLAPHWESNTMRVDIENQMAVDGIATLANTEVADVDLTVEYQFTPYPYGNVGFQVRKDIYALLYRDYLVLYKNGFKVHEVSFSPRTSGYFRLVAKDSQISLYLGYSILEVNDASPAISITLNSTEWYPSGSNHGVGTQAIGPVSIYATNEAGIKTFIYREPNGVSSPTTR